MIFLKDFLKNNLLGLDQNLFVFDFNSIFEFFWKVLFFDNYSVYVYSFLLIFLLLNKLKIIELFKEVIIAKRLSKD